MTDVMTSDVRSGLVSRLHHGHGDSEQLTTWGQVFLITLSIYNPAKYLKKIHRKILIFEDFGRNFFLETKIHLFVLSLNLDNDEIE